jgi:ubiquinone/menaquinone biosynthesis C-methylase UbiE
MSAVRFASVRDHFSRESEYWGAAYHRGDVTSLIYQERLALSLAWIDRLGPPHGARALDVGSGAGQATVALAKRGMQVDSMDASQAMTDLTRHNARLAGVGERVRATLGDALALDQADASHDIVVALGVIPWVPEPSRALAEIARVLHSGGHAIVSFANRERLTYRLDPLHNQDLQPLKRPLRAWLERLGWWASPSPEPTLHTVRDSQRLLAVAGLRSVAATTFGFGPFTLLGRHLFAQSADLWLHRHLQSMHSMRRRGSEYLVLARKLS